MRVRHMQWTHSFIVYLLVIIVCNLNIVGVQTLENGLLRQPPMVRTNFILYLFQETNQVLMLGLVNMATFSLCY
jgi:hypothetical protein